MGRKETFQKREALKLLILSKEAKEETTVSSLQVAFKIPDSRVHTKHWAFLAS